MNDRQAVRPSWWWCGLGVAVMVAGACLFAYTLIHDIPPLANALAQVVVPGQKDLNLMAQRTYTIFLEDQTVVNGQFYAMTESVSGLSCVVTSQASGDEIHISRPRMNTSYNFNGRQGRSMFEFVTQGAGVYHVACDYGEGQQGPKAVLAIGTGVGERILSALVKSLASLFGGLFLGAAIIVTVIVLRERAKRQLARPRQALEAQS